MLAVGRGIAVFIDIGDSFLQKVRNEEAVFDGLPKTVNEDRISEILIGVATLLLIGAGGLVTTKGAGLDVPDWPIRTRSEVRPPARISGSASVSHSLVSEGCIVEGTIVHNVRLSFGRLLH